MLLIWNLGVLIGHASAYQLWRLPVSVDDAMPTYSLAASFQPDYEAGRHPARAVNIVSNWLFPG